MENALRSSHPSLDSLAAAVDQIQVEVCVKGSEASFSAEHAGPPEAECPQGGNQGHGQVEGDTYAREQDPSVAHENLEDATPDSPVPTKNRDSHPPDFRAPRQPAFIPHASTSPPPRPDTPTPASLGSFPWAMEAPGRWTQRLKAMNTALRADKAAIEEKESLVDLDDIASGSTPFSAPSFPLPPPAHGALDTRMCGEGDGQGGLEFGLQQRQRQRQQDGAHVDGGGGESEGRNQEGGRARGQRKEVSSVRKRSEIEKRKGVREDDENRGQGAQDRGERMMEKGNGNGNDGGGGVERGGGGGLGVRGRGARGGSGGGLGGAGRSRGGTTAATKGGRGRALFLQRANSAQARARSSAHERETAPPDPLPKPLPNPPGNPHHADLPPSADTPPTSSSPFPLLLGLDSSGGTGGGGGGGKAEISVGRGRRPSAEGRRSACEGGGGCQVRV